MFYRSGTDSHLEKIRQIKNLTWGTIGLSCQISPRSNFKRQNLLDFWRGRPQKNKKKNNCWFSSAQRLATLIVSLCGILYVVASAVLRSDSWESKGDGRSVTIGSLQETEERPEAVERWRHRWRHVTLWRQSRHSRDIAIGNSTPTSHIIFSSERTSRLPPNSTITRWYSTQRHCVKGCHVALINIWTRKPS